MLWNIPIGLVLTLFGLPLSLIYAAVKFDRTAKKAVVDVAAVD